jgi:hypothetical protein
MALPLAFNFRGMVRANVEGFKVMSLHRDQREHHTS